MRKNNTQPKRFKFSRSPERKAQVDSFIESLFYAVRISTDENHRKNLSELVFEILKTETSKPTNDNPSSSTKSLSL